MNLRAGPGPRPQGSRRRRVSRHGAYARALSLVRPLRARNVSHRGRVTPPARRRTTGARSSGGLWCCVCTVYVLLYCTPTHNAVGPPRPPSSTRGFGCYCTHGLEPSPSFPHPRCHGLAAALAAMDDGPIAWRPEAKDPPGIQRLLDSGNGHVTIPCDASGQMAVSFFYCRQLLEVSFRFGYCCFGLCVCCVRFGCCCCVSCLLRIQ